MARAEVPPGGGWRHPPLALWQESPWISIFTYHLAVQGLSPFLNIAVRWWPKLALFCWHLLAPWPLAKGQGGGAFSGLPGTALSIQHRRQFQCQRPIWFGIADEDICHRARPLAQGHSINPSVRTLASEMRSLDYYLHVAVAIHSHIGDLEASL